MEDRMERERKVWNEHKDLLLAGERAKFEEEKTRLLKDLQQQLSVEHERCQRLEQKLYDAQMVFLLIFFSLEIYLFFSF
jgi:hypothetical protein